MKLNIGEISFLNCLPLFYRLQEEVPPEHDWQFVKGNPTQLNHGLANGKIDISPSSSMEFALRPEQYFIFPQLAITSHREVQSVILLSRQPLSALKNGNIALTGQSLTSVYLLKLILEHFYHHPHDNYHFVTREFNQFDDSVNAALVIGDRALYLFHHPPPGFQIHDLGALWYQFTGLPFVYALWIGNRQSLPDQQKALTKLHQRLLYCKTHLEGYFAKILPVTDRLYPQLSRKVILDYWQRVISYELGPRELAGLRLFYRLAHENQLLAEIPELHFLETSRNTG